MKTEFGRDEMSQNGENVVYGRLMKSLCINLPKKRSRRNLDCFGGDDNIYLWKRSSNRVIFLVKLSCTI